MRLLLRANAHRREPGGGMEIAASPDTRERERWQWDVHLAADPVGEAPLPASVESLVATGAMALADGSLVHVVARSAPAEAVPSVEIHHLADAMELCRGLHEVMLVVAGGPGLLVEGRHRLERLDALVLEGDDPLTLPLEADGAGPIPIAVIRLKGTGQLGWVP
ncbi:hypothetical protein [Arthrobacter sp. AQ5-05]|uniref:hypothetical protein n=1 Tax=Arthrobacter sp. AQ5-05 TaxID=2184581 RepID=UPI0011BD94F5|nr:hypothetical protein [Arthrobacter sp. AQ5-05]